MKKFLVILLVIVVSVVGTIAVQKFVLKEPGPGVAKIAPAEKNSFQQVTQNLDPGGSFYMYLGTEKIIETFKGFIETAKEMALSGAQDPEKTKWVGQVADIATMLLNDSGLFEISGIGVSSITMENGLNHGKAVVHHYKGKGKGLIWNLLDAKPHSLDSQGFLPANTVFARFADFKLKYFWEWLNKEAAAAGIPEVQKGLEGLKPMLKSKGFDLDAILGSLGGKAGIIVTLDENKKVKLPVMGQAIEIPDPAIALVIYVKDETIFNLVQQLSMLQPQVDGKVKKIIVPGPQPAPITLQPMIVQADNLLIIASNGKLVDDMLAGQGGAEGLLKTEEFKGLSVNMPAKGNSYTFLSEKVFKTIFEIQKKVVEISGKEAASAFSAFEKLKIFPKDLKVYNVVQNGAEGVVSTTNSNISIASAVILPAVAVVGIVAAIAVPNFIGAKTKGEQKATMGDMKSIGMAVESYLVDNAYAPQVKTMEELRKLLEPYYIKKLPLKDGWGFEFHYTHGTGEQQDTYSIASGGKDGVFEGFDQTGFYDMTGKDDFNRDIIFSNGMFVQGPKIR